MVQPATGVVTSTVRGVVLPLGVASVAQVTLPRLTAGVDRSVAPVGRLTAPLLMAEAPGAALAPLTARPAVASAPAAPVALGQAGASARAFGDGPGAGDASASTPDPRLLPHPAPPGPSVGALQRWLAPPWLPHSWVAEGSPSAGGNLTGASTPAARPAPFSSPRLGTASGAGEPGLASSGLAQAGGAAALLDFLAGLVLLAWKALQRASLRRPLTFAPLPLVPPG
ncbi:MAG TPA: hypothetical protein VMV93_10430 [Chloroflexota bacterium]|nr:hypothetical protein [Chloroflexota bacterium]